MSIACRGLYNDLARQVGAGTGNVDFEAAFVRAMNRVLAELAVATDKASKFATVTDNAATISGLDQSYEYILYAGCLFWLTRAGWRPAEPRIAAVVYDDTRKEWEKAKGEYKMDLDNIRQSDEDNDMVKLGTVT